MDAADWDARYAGSSLIWTAEPNRFLVEHTADVAPGRALDVACGEGRNAVWLATRGFEVTAIDFSPVAIDKARRVAAASDVASVNWIVGDVTAELPAGPFDLAVVLYLHLPTDAIEQMIDRLCELLAPGGTLLLVGHHVDNLTDGYGGPQDPAILHDHRAIAGRIVAHESMAVVTAARVERRVAVDDLEHVALDSVVRAARVQLDAR